MPLKHHSNVNCVSFAVFAHIVPLSYNPKNMHSVKKHHRNTVSKRIGSQLSQKNHYKHTTGSVDALGFGNAVGDAGHNAKVTRTLHSKQEIL